MLGSSQAAIGATAGIATAHRLGMEGVLGRSILGTDWVPAPAMLAIVMRGGLA